MYKNNLCFVFLMTMAFASYAQPIYKSIGPDGKVIYSDKPPMNSDAKHSVMGKSAPPSQTTSSAEASSSSAGKAESHGPNFANAKKATRVKTSNADSSAQVEADPALEKAVLGVMGLENLVEQTGTICARTLPTSLKKYQGAVDSWKQRNADILDKQKKILKEMFNQSEQLTLHTGARAKNQAVLEQILNAPFASRVKWCDQSTDEINGSATDLAGKPHLSVPILNWKTRL